MKKKLVFLGDVDSINIELVIKSHKQLKNRVDYILLGNINDLRKYLTKLNSYLKINEIHDPISFANYKKDELNLFNINNVSKHKYLNLLKQIDISNYLSNSSKIDLVTLPINKYLFKKKIAFTGITEYLGKINNTDTKMLMHGDKFSIIPLTTHINLNQVNKIINKDILSNNLKKILSEIKKKIYQLYFNEIKFLCFNPHCGEKNTLGIEDTIIKKTLTKFGKIHGPLAADSAFNFIDKKTLFISTYHDQALIPFKILNKKSINLTLGLNYRRLSPAHGTASDIKFKNMANISSYIACMEY